MRMIQTIALTATAAVVAGVVLHRKLRQYRTTAALRLENSCGIQEDYFVNIGGIEQWIGIRGEDEANPVLLLIHGGPGSSCSIFTPLIRSWESQFTVVQWDQRGSGKTLGRTGKGGTGALTMERLIRDGIEVAEFVRARLHKHKIILLAHSFGTTFGLSLTRRRPDLFSAYVGSDQNVGMLRNREQRHAAVIERLRSLGLRKGVSFFQKISPNPSNWTPQDFFTAARWTMRSDPPTCAASQKLLLSSLWFAPSHTLRDLKLFFSGMNFSIARLLPDIRSFDAWHAGTHFEIPFFIFQGANDVLTPPILAREYFEDVIAPLKHMTIIRNAGHFAAFTQPDQFLRALLDHVRPIAVEQASASQSR